MSIFKNNLQAGNEQCEKAQKKFYVVLARKQNLFWAFS